MKEVSAENTTTTTTTTTTTAKNANRLLRKSSEKGLPKDF